MNAPAEQQHRSLDLVLDKLEQGRQPSAGELAPLFDLQGPARERLFGAARSARASSHGARVYLYGFIYLSTYCRNDCAFCQFRRSNAGQERSRKSLEAVREAGLRLAEDGVDLLDLTLGEDPFYRDGSGFARLLELVAELKRAAGLPIMVSPGLATRAQLERLAGAGADWYACYQETHNPEFFPRLRLGQNYAERFAAKLEARNAGLLVEEGMLAGVGESAADLAESVRVMAAAPFAQVRAMTYVPHPSTLLAPSPTPGRELNAIAVMRLLMPDRLIPASLDVEGLRGLAGRLEAGANVITSLIPSGRGFSGVASRLDIEESRRSVGAVRAELARLGLEPGGPAAYRAWLEGCKADLSRAEPGAKTCA